MRNEKHILSAGKVTMYYQGDFGRMRKVEAKECAVFEGGFAQHEQAWRCEFKKPRQKQARELLQYGQHHRTLVILEGWGHPDPDSGWLPAEGRMQQAKYRSCDPRWTGDFRQMLAGYLEESGAKVVFDVVAA